MAGVKSKIFWSAVTAAAGVTGIVMASNCPKGSACTGCFGCAAAGVGILALVVVQKVWKGGKGDEAR